EGKIALGLPVGKKRNDLQKKLATKFGKDGKSEEDAGNRGRYGNYAAMWKCHRCILKDGVVFFSVGGFHFVRKAGKGLFSTSAPRSAFSRIRSENNLSTLVKRGASIGVACY
ncbi:MAG: hypothetical protein J3T61_11775, partial [Candidatus Brocadiales bacterium]|nr:hypothetical protein [Candidatus Bathyanammoxibius sp.]